MESIDQSLRNSGWLKSRSRSLLVFTLFTAIYSGMAATVKAQTFAEWFQQNSTQKKYLLQQIAALQVFSTYLKQGYQVAHNGLGSISDSLGSENSLHTAYYNRMEMAGAAVKNDGQVKEILSWQNDILTILGGLDQIDGLTNEEKKYLSGVRSAVLKDCDQQISTLQSIVTDGKVKMSDADRIVLIGKIHAAMQENYHFATGFINQAKAYALQRRQEQKDALTAKQMNGVN
ncbi:hypothetical protein KXD93_30390 [Mucilaginibacter sp. BJC16-A38]|uniref:hypothetical protein n=1 Tax=Mucilaginibacter phenanthrenivorans TaxID=1234842 RepID=UPI00215855AC|nr:hypothetical protein [Mucilaginibacter phenanthrenivorans]MCR8562003.1 hypothetical protein [Mucilaginibacter phenanthrenivorans]